MWKYEKRLQYPVNIKTPNAKVAQYIMSQYGGPDGEINASLRYLSQRFTAANRVCMGVLNDIGTEASEMFPKTFFCTFFTRKLFLTNIRAEDILCL